jgi:hypothetical protein
MSENSIRVEIQYRDVKHVAEGNADQVFAEIMKFFSNLYPALQVISSISFTPDYADLTKKLAEFVNIGPEGEILLLKSGLSADTAIGMVLLGAHVARKIGKKQSDDMSVEELSSATRKALKTVRNTIVEMAKTSILERTGRGTYRVTTVGMKDLLDDITAKTDSQNQGGAG